MSINNVVAQVFFPIVLFGAYAVWYFLGINITLGQLVTMLIAASGLMALGMMLEKIPIGIAYAATTSVVALPHIQHTFGWPLLLILAVMLILIAAINDEVLPKVAYHVQYTAGVATVWYMVSSMLAGDLVLVCLLAVILIELPILVWLFEDAKLTRIKNCRAAL
jgi:hypothetical protein